MLWHRTCCCANLVNLRNSSTYDVVMSHLDLSLFSDNFLALHGNYI